MCFEVLSERFELLAATSTVPRIHQYETLTLDWLCAENERLEEASYSRKVYWKSYEGSVRTTSLRQVD